MQKAAELNLKKNSFKKKQRGSDAEWGAGNSSMQGTHIPFQPLYIQWLDIFLVFARHFQAAGQRKWRVPGRFLPPRIPQQGNDSIFSALPLCLACLAQTLVLPVTNCGITSQPCDLCGFVSSSKEIMLMGSFSQSCYIWPQTTFSVSTW